MKKETLIKVQDKENKMSFGKAPVICDWCGKQRNEDANHWMTIKCSAEEGITFKAGVLTAGVKL